MAGSRPPEPLKAGAAPRAPLVKTFTCTHCGANVTVRASGFSLVATCSACLSVIDVTNESFNILATYQKKLRVQPVIPIGARGKLKGELFEMIGMLQKTDATGAYAWEEYLLFNPYKGYRWLSVYQGHWTLFQMTKQQPEPSPFIPFKASGLTHLGKSYTRFQAGQARVSFVVGEFYWRAQVDAVTETEDFIAPPYMLSSEKDKDELIWSLGEYLEPAVVAEAFGLKELPERIGVGANQPLSGEGAATRVYQYFWLAAAALFVVQLATGTASGTSVFSERFSVKTGEVKLPGSTAAADATFTTAPFLLLKDVDSVTFHLAADLDNDWLDFNIGLFEQPPGEKAYRFEHGFEYYSGYDSDGAWTEGSRHTSITLSAIPRGTYYATLEASGAVGTPKEHKVSLWIERGGPLWSNFFLGLVALALYPLVLCVRNISFEGRRWQGSDFSPYAVTVGGGSDDDE